MSQGGVAVSFLGSDGHSDRSEPRWGCFWLAHWEVRDKGGPWRQDQGMSPRDLLLPAGPLVASLVGILRV